MPFTDFFQRNYGFKYYEFVKFYGIGPWSHLLASIDRIEERGNAIAFTLI